MNLIRPVNGKATTIDLTLNYVAPVAKSGAPVVDEYKAIQQEIESVVGPLLAPRGFSNESYDAAFGLWKSTLTFEAPVTDAEKVKKALSDARLANVTAAIVRTNRKNWNVSGSLASASPDDVHAAVANAFASTKELALSNPFPRVRFIGPNVVANLKASAFESMLLSLVFMMAYIWLRFKEMKYGIASTIALIHDVLVALGISVVANKFGLVPTPITLNAVAACLMIVGYSVNDTIVTFDRIRENLGQTSGKFEDICNLSINQTFARSLFTSLTVFLTTWRSTSATSASKVRSKASVSRSASACWRVPLLRSTSRRRW